MYIHTWSESLAGYSPQGRGSRTRLSGRAHVAQGDSALWRDRCGKQSEQSGYLRVYNLYAPLRTRIQGNAAKQLHSNKDF